MKVESPDAVDTDSGPPTDGGEPQTEPGPRLSDDALGRVAMAGVILTLVVLVSITLAAISTPALSLPPAVDSVVHDAVPEGWQFFTKDPQDANPLPFRHTGRRWYSIQRQGALHPTTVFGLDRVAREQGVEIGIISQEIPAKAWLPCKLAPTQCLAQLPIEAHVADPVSYPTMCGDVGIASQVPVPWAWAQIYPLPIMPSKVVRVEVSCRYRP